MSSALISPKQLCPNQNTMAQDGSPILVDVRTPMEFQEIHANGARNVPLDRLNPQQLLIDLSASPNDTIYFICHSGARSSRACQQMQAAGLDKVCSVEGGTKAWESSGLPVVRGKAVMSLERQVRIAAGSIVAIGGLLAFFVHPYWGLLPATAGIGLVFAGATDSCIMGMVLSKMPWNQAPCDTHKQAFTSRKCEAQPTGPASNSNGSFPP